MFQGFTQQTSEFLWDLSFNNERPWFQAHRETFEEVLNQPFRELAKEVFALMRQRWEERDFQIHVSRIYRDARRLFGRGPYKDHLWFSVQSGDWRSLAPTFWFEIGAATYSCGMGFWGATPAQMEAYRRQIDANPARFERLVRELNECGGFRLWGEEYKRPKADRGELVNPWYNRKYVSVGWERDFGGDALSAQLPQIILDTYEKLMPLFDYFEEFFRAAGDTEARA